jgi:DNA-binding NtrC family response regulator
LIGAAAEVALFGTEHGSGRLALAVAGSLYLEDVDRLPPEVQRRLAAALEAADGTRGGPRVIASTGPQAALHTELGQVLEVLSIDVAPLRTRREDVPLLAERFMGDLAREYGRRPRRFAPDCMAAMRSHAWPGNVRELHNLVEGLLLSGEDELIRLAELPERFGGAGSASEDLYREFASLAEAVECFERYYVGRVLSEEGADTVTAARRLGLTHEALRARLRQRE